MPELKDMLYVAGALMSIGAYVYAWASARGKVNAAAIGTLDRRLDSLEKKLVRVESSIEGLPQVRNELGAVHRRIDEVASLTHNIDGQLRQINRSIGTITTHLLDQKPKP